MNKHELQLNEAAFRRMEVDIKRRFPYGHFVALVDGEIVGDAADFMTLYQAMQRAGHAPRDVFIIQAGHEYSTKEVKIYI